MIVSGASKTDYKRLEFLPSPTGLSLRAEVVSSHSFRNAGVAELADALDSKSSDRKIVWVRAPPPAVPEFDV
jgi:hypothetical protein